MANDIKNMMNRCLGRREKLSMAQYIAMREYALDYLALYRIHPFWSGESFSFRLSSARQNAIDIVYCGDKPPRPRDRTPLPLP